MHHKLLSKKCTETCRKVLLKLKVGQQSGLASCEFAKARDIDALTVGDKLSVTYSHGDDSLAMLSRFGTKGSDLWIEASVANLAFIATAMRSDYHAGRFADSRPRGPHFRIDAAGGAAENEPEQAEMPEGDREHAVQDEVTE